VKIKGLALIDKNLVQWIEKEAPIAGPRDAIVRPVAVCPCTTDAHGVETMALKHMKGLFLGHEAIGTIVEVGREVKDFKPGDYVVVPSVTPEWNSMEVQDGLSKFSNGYGFLFTRTKDGVFAELFHVNDADMNLAHLPDGMSPVKAVMAVDMLATGCAGAEAADIRFGDTVVVIGIGPVGLMSICAARLQGAGKIIAIGSRKACVDLAKHYGATEVVNYKTDDIQKSVFAVNGGKPADVAIVAGGSSGMVSTALGLVNRGGTISVVATFLSDSTTVLSNDDWLSDKTIKKIMVPGGRRYMERMLNLIQFNRVDPEPLASHIFHGFDKIRDALQLMMDKPQGLIKPVVLI
jgi:threonine dehydrogenase-like Zn-dependent dehydrogenase